MAAEGHSISELLQYLAPGATWNSLVHWPPDAFAVAGSALADSGAYRLVVSPPGDKTWPPEGVGRTWAQEVRQLGQEWAKATGPGLRNDPPRAVVELATALDESGEVSLDRLCDEQHWAVAEKLLWLFAAADEACAGVHAGEEVQPTAFHVRAAAPLGLRGSLGTLSVKRVRVLPKLRVPESGITIRSLSRYIAFHRSEVATHWASAAAPQPVDESLSDSVTILVVPWPEVTYPTSFKPLEPDEVPLVNMDQERFGFFQFVPNTPFDPAQVVKLVERARAQVGAVDIVVLPESVLEEAQAEELRELLLDAKVDYLIAGVRSSATEHHFGANYAYVAGRSGKRDWSIKQHKHHRWFLDKSQIQQYHIGSSLSATRKWWEAIDVKARSLAFVEIHNSLVMCPLVCEDLARPDPVADIIRSVGPSLVVALLLDGPQLAERWPARYATVLADDPGSAVLTVSSLVLVLRCAPPGMKPRRVVALWKDRSTGPLEIELEPGAHAIAVTTSLGTSRGVTADGRPEVGSTTDLFLTGVEQIQLSGPAIEPPTPQEPHRRFSGRGLIARLFRFLRLSSFRNRQWRPVEGSSGA